MKQKITKKEMEKFWSIWTKECGLLTNPKLVKKEIRKTIEIIKNAPNSDIIVNRILYLQALGNLPITKELQKEIQKVVK